MFEIHQHGASNYGRSLDVGAGNGFFSHELQKNKVCEIAVCQDIGYTERQLISNKGEPIKYVNEVTDGKFDLVLMIDVLEHVDQDQALVEKYIQFCKKDAHFIISVPASMLLWGRHDEYLGHKRRYTIDQLHSMLQKAGLDVININYFFFLIFPIVFLYRKFNRDNRSNLKMHGRAVNFLLKKICELEFFIAKKNRLFGVSVICFAKLDQPSKKLQ